LFRVGLIPLDNSISVIQKKFADTYLTWSNNLDIFRGEIRYYEYFGFKLLMRNNESER